MADSKRDSNYVPTLTGVDYSNMTTPELITVDPVNGRMLVSAIVTSITAATTERYDYSSSTSIYTGSADIGTADASTGWTIVLYDLASSSAASGKVATDVSWNNRATGTFA